MTEPLYQSIAEDLEAQIRSGELPPGSQLRTEQALQEKYEASRNTVRDAVKRLIARGLVETRPGQGTFVLEKIVPFVTTLSTDPEKGSSEGAVHQGETEVEPAKSRPRVEIQQAAPDVALALGLGRAGEVVSRHQERYVGDTPWSLQTSFYPLTLVTAGAQRLLQPQDIQQGTVEYLKDTLGLAQAGYRDTITVRAPKASESSFFGVPADGRVAILEAFRTAFDQHGKPLRVTITVYPADRTRFAINAGKVPPGAPGVVTGQARNTADTDQGTGRAPARGG
jgi:GntR family transcriptional regulator